MDFAVGPARRAAPAAAPDEAAQVRSLLEAVFEVYHYDFRGYTAGSIQRRVRSAMEQLGCASVAQLRAQVLTNAQRFSALLNFLTVPVSEMFRDPQHYHALRTQVVPLLRTYPSIRIWVAGCAAGEEALSCAILLREAGLLDRSLIYATDINPACLAKARSGVLEIERLAPFSDNYRRSGGSGSLSDHYVAAYGKAVFDRGLREHIVFADHSLATDGVFAEVQLVSCRNVLIYFQRELQQRALGLFAEALCHRGFLGLGIRESVRFSGCAADFEPVAMLERIYRKRGARR
jgi:chemotaxis protein methyltransferase CheR